MYVSTGSKSCTYWCGRNTVCDPVSCQKVNPRHCLTTKTTTTESLATTRSLCTENYRPTEQKCIRIFAEPATWLSALITCVQDGGNLLSIDQPGDLAGIPGTSSWIGLSDIQGEGEFFWSDGSALNFTNWNWNQPLT